MVKLLTIAAGLASVLSMVEANDAKEVPRYAAFPMHIKKRQAPVNATLTETVRSTVTETLGQQTSDSGISVSLPQVSDILPGGGQPTTTTTTRTTTTAANDDTPTIPVSIPQQDTTTTTTSRTLPTTINGNPDEGDPTTTTTTTRQGVIPSIISDLTSVVNTIVNPDPDPTTTTVNVIPVPITTTTTTTAPAVVVPVTTTTTTRPPIIDPNPIGSSIISSIVSVITDPPLPGPQPTTTTTTTQAPPGNQPVTTTTTAGQNPIESLTSGIGGVISSIVNPPGGTTTTTIGLPPIISTTTSISLPPIISTTTSIGLPPGVSTTTSIGLPPGVSTTTSIGLPPGVSTTTSISLPPVISTTTPSTTTTTTGSGDSVVSPPGGSSTTTTTTKPSETPVSPPSTQPTLGIAPTTTSSSAFSETTIVPTATDTLTSQFLPSSIISDTRTKTSASTTATTDSGIPSALPNALSNPFNAGNVPDQPINSTLCNFAFYEGLHYDFVVNSQYAIKEIFLYTPKAVAYGLNLTDQKEIMMHTLRPYDTSAAGYITTLALFYLPDNQVDDLQAQLTAGNSWFHSKEPTDDPTAVFISLIDTSFPLRAANVDPIGNPGTASNGNTGGANNPTNLNAGQTSSANGSNGGSVNPTVVGGAVGAVVGACAYAAIMYYVARRYRQHRAAHSRSSSVIDTSTMPEMASGAGAGAALMGGARGYTDHDGYYTDGRNSRQSGHSGSSRGRDISGPLAAENSLGWN